MGVPNAFPPLVGSAYVVGDNLERLASIMLYGLIGPITVNGAEYNSVMTPFNHLSDDELAAIATHIRSSWGNSASAVEPQVFADQRARWGQRGQFRIEELGAEE
jgi:mono/diheme cytochrome c family protein